MKLMRNRRKNAEIKAAVAQLRDPLAVVPVIAEGVEAREDANGLLQIRKTPSCGRALTSRLSQRLGLQRHIRVNLDAHGTIFWRAIDGRRCLREIAEVVFRQTRQDPEAATEAAVLFVKMLMVRHLVYLKVPE